MESIEAHTLEQIESTLNRHEVRDVEHTYVDHAGAVQRMQYDVNQWYDHDEEDDVQSGTRKAEEQMRGSDGAVGEVYNDSPTGRNGQDREEGEEKECDVDHGDMGSNSTDTAIDVFPGGPIEPTANSSGDHHEPTHPLEPPTFSGSQAETSEGSTSLRDKRKPIYRNQDSFGQVATSAAPKIQTPQFQGKGSDAGTVAQDADLQAVRPPSMFFPGPSFVPRGVKAAERVVQSSPQATRHTHAIREPRHENAKPLPDIPDESGHDGVTNPLDLSRRRKFDEVEQPDVHIRTPQDHDLTQLENWESMKEEIASVRRNMDDLEKNRIYILSSVDLEELASRRHPKYNRLWSWSNTEKGQFHDQIDRLLHKGFQLQMLISEQHSLGGGYRMVPHMEYWKAYFTDRTLYWLAVVTPEPANSQLPKKVRRIEKAREFLDEAF